ncbi:response regulator [Iodidimonas sp. SYSU 1G8]|uniref:response regulator n=1 Tax=Iodidimonas sp. SYSU 1G8 TaxID=3133967 RepID=UPI0031FF3141
MTVRSAHGSILIVDDEAEILVALEDLFESSYRVITTTSPQHALDLLKSGEDVWVIISDQRMPEMTGDVFLARARELTQAEAILLTGYADIEAVAAAVNRGGIVGYAPKPWDPAVLRAMVGGAYERYRLARALDQERALFHGLLDNTSDAVSFKDAEGRFIRLNAIKAGTFGLPVEACLGKTEDALRENHAASAATEADQAAMTTGEPSESLEERHDTEHGERWLAVSRIPLTQPGSPARLVVIERDVTKQRHLEERLRQADKMQALGTLAGGVAHDFNNLLTAVLGNLHLARKAVPEGSRLRRQIENAAMAAERGSGLTQRLLSFSRRKGLTAEAVDVDDLVAGMDDLLARTLGGLVVLDKRIESDLWAATADADQLELVILNLCINARDAMPDGGTITLTARNERIDVGQVDGLGSGEYVVLGVGDTGTGMSPDVLRRALEPFFTTKDGKGTGLGLSMAYGVAQQLGGALTIQSAWGEGTLVELYLPRAQADAIARILHEGGNVPAIAPAHVLLVDDDDGVREVLCEYLSELGHSAVAASSGQEALDILNGPDQFDLLIADFAMPGMTGLELMLQARADRPDLPVLLVSGHTDFVRIPDDVPVLMKPCDESELAARIAVILDGRARVARPAGPA